jgi:cytochrome c oxidase subunit III
MTAARDEVELIDKGKVGTAALILTETALFSVFVVAYVFYLGKSVKGPFPKDVLTTPVWATICLLSSSVTAEVAIRALRRGSGAFKLWLAATILLGLEFLHRTAVEWDHLIRVDHLTIKSNLFGTTFYALVGLHATHVAIGLCLLLLVLLLSLTGAEVLKHAHRVELLGWYWHFVDAVWVVVFTVVYVMGR